MVKSPLLFSLPVLIALASCQSTYYSAMEKFGYEKRDLLVERVEDARDAQETTKEAFANTLEEFSTLIDFDGGDLERLYDRLKGRLASSEDSAAAVTARINSIERVARDLFREWEAELAQYNNAELRRKSSEQLERTRQRCDDLVATMRRAESKIPPVLSAFQDQVLFLKHNLNAQAVASLENEAVQIQDDVSNLIAEMEAAIAEANAFIDSMR